MPGFSTRATLISLVLLISLGAAAVWQFGVPFIDTRHEVTAKFQRRSDSAGQGGKDDVISNEYEKLRSIMMYNFKGRPAIEQLIKDLNLARELPHHADGSLTPEGFKAYHALIQSLMESISVSTDISTNEIDLITVTVRHADPALVSKIANKLVENYMTMVRKEMDDQLLDSRKLMDTEVNRYRRKVSELEKQLLELVATWPPDTNVQSFIPPAPYETTYAGRQKAHADAVKRLNRLRELTGGKPLGDRTILELFRLEEEVEETKEALASLEANKESLTALHRDYVKIRNEYLKITGDLKEAREQLVMWSEGMARIQLAMTLNVGDRGLRMSFVQRAPDSVN